MQSLPTPPEQIVVTRPDGTREVIADSDDALVVTPPQAPDTRNWMQKKLDTARDWLKGHPVPTPVKALYPWLDFGKQQVEGNLDLVAHPIERLPELGAFLATLPLGGEGAAARPLLNAARAGAGYFAGSLAKDTPDLLAGTKSVSDSARAALPGAAANAAAQAVGERFLTGLTPATTPEAQARVAAIDAMRGQTPNVSAGTVLGPGQGMVNSALRGVEGIANHFLLGGAVSRAADRQAAPLIEAEMRRIPNVPSTVMDPQSLGAMVRSGLRGQEAAQADRLLSQQEVLNRARAAEHAALQDTTAQQAAAAAKAETTPLSQRPSMFDDTSLFSSRRTPEPPVPTDAAHRAIDAKYDALQKTIMNSKGVLAKDEKAVVSKLFNGAPETVLEALDRKSLSAVQRINTALNAPQRKAFADAFIDKHILSDTSGAADAAGVLKRLQEAKDSGVLRALLPKNTAQQTIDRMTALAEVAQGVKGAKTSFTQALKAGSGAGTAATGLLSGSLSGAQAAFFQHIGVGEVTSALLNATLRAPVTRRLLLNGLTDANGARAAASIARALHLTQQQQISDILR